MPVVPIQPHSYKSSETDRHFSDNSHALSYHSLGTQLHAQSIVDTIRQPLVVLSDTLCILIANPAFHTTFQLKPHEVVGKFIYELDNGQWNLPELRHLLEGLLHQGSEVKEYEVEANFPRIGMRTFDLFANTLVNATLPMVLLSFEDVTMRRHSEEVIKKANRQLEKRVAERTREVKRTTTVLEELNIRHRTILESITDAFFALDSSWRFTYINSQAENIFARPKEELLEKSIWELFPEMVGSLAYSKYYEAHESLRSLEFEEYLPDRDKWYQVRVYPSHEGLSVFLADTTERKKIEAAMRHQSLHDRLTGLPNRFLFDGRLTQALLTAQNSNQSLAVLFLDLDRFKTVNDTLGHAKGDAILCQLAKRLHVFARGQDMVARFGADEFLIMVNDLPHIGVAEEMAKKIGVILEEPFKVDDQDIHINASVGIALYPEAGDTPESLLRNADAALYQAKEMGGNTYKFYQPTMHSKASQYLTLENQMRKAVEKKEFVVYYQPVIDIHSGEVMYVEALVRWNHPNLGLIFPGEFIPMAEETGTIVPLGEWMVSEIAEDIRQWRKNGWANAAVAINVSARQFLEADFCAILERSLQEKKIPGEAIRIEITESMAMQNVAATIEKLQCLKALNIHASIDDFGTGHSSLSYLKQLPIDALKIDKSFIQSCAEDVRDAAIVKAIVSLGHTLSLNVCAEGIESYEQLQFLAQTGCDSVQGFLFSKSLPREQFIHWIDRYRGEKRYLLSA